MHETCMKLSKIFQLKRSQDIKKYYSTLLSRQTFRILVRKFLRNIIFERALIEEEINFQSI
jgi:hypothetical protein